MITFGGLVTASLSMMVSENKKISRRHLANQVEMQARGGLEIAKNIVNAASYDVFMQNRALQDAISDPNGLIANTDVTVSRVGTARYFVLRTEATIHGITKRAEAIVRQVSPASSNNLMVIDHPVGLSGSPRGAIHSNKYIDFYFPGGNYRDQVTAVEGFNFVSGASKDNTTFAGPINPTAPLSRPLQGRDSTCSQADVLSVTENLISEVTLMGATAQVKLFRPAHETLEPVVEPPGCSATWPPRQNRLAAGGLGIIRHNKCRAQVIRDHTIRRNRPCPARRFGGCGHIAQCINLACRKLTFDQTRSSRAARNI